MRVVFSNDFTRTLVFGVMGELASFSGLKLRIVFRIRLDVAGLFRIRIERVFSVASTIIASLRITLLVGGYGKVFRRIFLPAVLLQYREHSVQESRGFSLELGGFENRVIRRDHG